MADRSTIDLLISGGSILCMDGPRRVLEDHAIAIHQGKIVEICAAGKHLYQPRKTIDASDCIVMPGLINAHTHLPMTYFRGLADDLPLEQWLRGYIWPLEAKLLDAEFIHHAALHGAAEMIRNGITQIHDMYFQPTACAEACTEAGLRAIIGEVVLNLDPNTRLAPSSIGSAVLQHRESYRDNGLIDFDLAPHSIYACPKATLQECVRVARDHNIRLHLHLSESRSEVEQCLQTHGQRPVFYLQELGMLDLPALYAHAIWLDQAEIECLAASPSSVAICTESNLKLGSGILPLASLHRAGVNLCFATDGVASNNNLDLLAELDFTAKLHKAVNNDPAFLPAQDVLAMATINAAQALGVADRRGSLETGKDADICILDLNDLQGQPVYNPYSHVVYALGSRNVRDVVIAGEVVLEQGKLTRLDEAELIRTAKRYQTRIAAELKL